MTTTEHPQELHREEPHEELPPADLELPEESAGDVTGGTRVACEEWGCGSNHNEVLALTA